MDKVKAFWTLVVSGLFDILGILAVPVFLLVGCNVMDYITGLLAAPYREEEVKSYKSIKGITKKVCMWLLVIVGALLDILINYSIHTVGIPVDIPFIVGTLVAVWLTLSEIISILENMIDIGVRMPPFLMPLVKYIRHKVEDKAKIEEDKKDGC